MAQNFMQNTDTARFPSNMLRQQKVLEYVTDIGSSLHLQMDVKTLLNRIALATCEALRFRHCALYLLSNVDGHFHVEATYGISSEEEMYLKRHALPNEVVALLVDEAYRISHSYFIPTESLLWQNELFSTYFLTIEEEQPITTTQYPVNEWQTTDLIVIPLVSADNTLLGLLTPDAPLDGMRPDIELMTSLELLANQASIVIEGSRLYEEAKQNSEERAALIKIGQALFLPDALRDLRSVYETIHEQVQRVMPTDAFLVIRYASEEDRIFLDYVVDEGIVYQLEQYEEVPAWVSKLILAKHTSIVLNKKEEYEAFIDVAVQRSHNDYLGSMKPSESLLFVPNHFGETILGTLSVQSYTPHAYTQRHVEMLQEISVQAGIAIMNARLYTELRDAVKRAQESEQLKNHFLMIASHELRTPLTAIQGYLELLSIHGSSLSEKDRTRFVSNARRASEEVILLLGNVMDTSHINQKEIALNLKKVQLRQTLLPVLDILEPTLVRQKRKVDDTLDDTLSVLADEARLRQILLNILNNAIKYTPTGTNIRISAEVQSSSLLPKAFQTSQPDVQFVVLAIRDWGNGIAAEDLERLFTKFVRLPSAVDSMQHGSGLGLYLCRQLVEAMNGAIWAESADIHGEGATFFIALPQVLS